MDTKKKDIEYQAEWHDKWMKFLAPLVGAAVTALDLEISFGAGDLPADTTMSIIIDYLLLSETEPS